MSSTGVFIEGKGGNIGKDLAIVARQSDIEVCETAHDAEFVALCTPASVAQDRLFEGLYRNKVVIDFSGASKRNHIGQYGLMLTAQEPWDTKFDPRAKVFGNPGCIASAVLKGLHASGIRKHSPRSIAITAIGGSSYAHNVDNQEISLAKRLIEHPHVPEITTALAGLTRITSFMPVISGGVERGLIVTVSGQVAETTNLDSGEASISVGKVTETADIIHRLEVNETPGRRDFSLAVAIDNLRFVTQNAVDLMTLVTK